MTILHCRPTVYNCSEITNQEWNFTAALVQLPKFKKKMPWITEEIAVVYCKFIGSWYYSSSDIIVVVIL
jgi:hypothetical protein